MYENEITLLEREQAVYLTKEQRLCIADVLRAAQPKDESVEEEICFSIAVPETDSPMSVGRLTDLLIRVRASARADGYAAGRAEGSAAGRADQSKIPCVQHGDHLALRRVLDGLRKDVLSWKRQVELLEQVERKGNEMLAAVQAELALEKANHTAHIDQYESHMAEDATALKVAQAEIDSWKKAHEFLRTSCANAQRKFESEHVQRLNETRALEIKLTLLRAAAEHFESWYSSEDFDSLDTKHATAFRSAIEESI